MKKIIISIIILLFTLSIVSYKSYKRGRIKGFEKGMEVSFDTINKIFKAQIKSDTTVTRLIIQDTTIYNLSRKTLLKKNNE